MPLAPSTRLGTYEILAPLGAGGMGEVYRARDLRLGREVAVKVLPAGVASSPDRLARLEREARTVAALSHPNIVTLFSVEDEDGVRFLTMELVEGQSFADLIAPGGLPFPRLLDLSIQVADALVAAHERGVVHRDLKPGNVMVTRDGRVKVLDFGLARTASGGAAGPDALGLTQDSPATDEGSVQGTAPYMAPEQIRGEPVDARTDLFGLGVTLYEVATGRRPFSGTTSIDIASSVLRDTPEALTRVRPDLPAGFERVVARCLEKNPRERFQTALDVSHELRLLHRAPGSGPAGAGGERIASIAVLPFVNRSRAEEDEYFSDGLADELLNLLAKIRGLRVAARASSFQFKEKKGDLASIGRVLNVATLLDGSVRKAGNRVRIAVQLINVADGYHLWSETYDRTLDDIFAVQDDIAQSVVTELRAALLGEPTDPGASGRARAEVAKAARGRAQNTESHRLALQGRHLIERLTSEDALRGMGHLREALRLDPEHAMAWVDLARAHLNAAGHGWEPAEPSIATAREAALRARSIEPDLPEAHIVLGRIHLYFGWNWKEAEASYRRAMELSPGNAIGLHGIGILAQNAGRLEEALELYRRAVEQDPLSAGAYTRLGQGYLSAGRPAEAEAAYRKAIELAPQRILTRANLSLALVDQGRPAEALEWAEREPQRIYRLLALVAVHRALGRESDSAAALRTFVETEAAHGAFQIAEAHAIRDEIDEAFVWLERAYAQRDPGLAEVKGSSLLRCLHRDPRWKAFLRKMGLEG